MSAAEALLNRIVDYAGLFPPAALDMETAVRNYQKYLGGDGAWMLGNFLVPAARLTEFEAAFRNVCCDEQEAPWTLSIVCSGTSADDARAIAEFQEGAAFIGGLEAKAADARAAEATVGGLPSSRARYVEFPPERAPEVLPVLAKRGARAKIRMGGVTPESIPSVEAVAQFLLACAESRVAWKATAGLHHALRGVREIAPGGLRVAMHGFVNLFLAGALAYFGAGEAAVMKTLSEEEAGAWQADGDVVHWHDNTLIADQIEQVRSRFAIGFGSCSFAEPVDDLKEMEWV